MTPAERSNSPPIISNATGTAMIPMFEASSLQRAKPSRPAKPVAVIANSANTAARPTSDPISGRRKTCERIPTRASRSSAGAAGGVAVAACWDITGAAAGRLSAPPPSPRLARALRRQLDHLRRVRLVHETRSRQHRLAAADGVRVRVVQVEEHDREISLQVLLLVDREQDVPRGDRFQEVGGEVEARDLCRRLHALRRLVRREADLRVESEDRVDRLVRLELRADLVLCRREILHARHLEPRDAAAERLLRAGEPLLEADVALFVNDDQEVLHTLGL